VALLASYLPAGHVGGPNYCVAARIAALQLN
jgi:hypothetical protein